MAANYVNTAATHFGRQMHKERLAHGWTLRQLSAMTKVDYTTLSRVERGVRAPTEKLAKECDRLFPGRRGWFTDWANDSRKWAEIPPAFRNWPEIEEKAKTLRDWYPGIVTGLLQTEQYSRAILQTFPGVSPEATAARLANRMDRQRRALHREGARVTFVVDEVALFRYVGSPEIMAEQCDHLAAIARLPHVTLQIIPAVAHPANSSGFIIADDAVWCDSLLGAGVYTGDAVSLISVIFDALRAECYRASESPARLERMAEIWRTGASQPTATPTAASASKPRRRPARSSSATPPTAPAPR
jgi:hypothetical protein